MLNRVRRGVEWLQRQTVERWREPMLKPGDIAPDFAVADHEGRTWKLADLRGKYVVLWFYPVADTPG